MKLSRLNIILQLFFALLLVVAQGQLLVHQTDLEAHSDQAACEVCIYTSHLGSAALGGAEIITLSTNSAIYTSPNYVLTEVALYYTLPQSRAPPASSLS